MDGFFIIDKPKGITSQGVVAKIKKQFQLKRCGHTGTLDPDATGVLVVACGTATKLIRFLEEKKKKYFTTVVFGYDSNTLDIYGQIAQDIDMNFTIEELNQALEVLKKQTEQLPPMVSAIKVNGKKLYEYERKNQKVEVKKRPVAIYDLVKKSPLRHVENHLEIDIEITCSKGFYVRSFARDLGELLGGCAILKELRRLQSGDFLIENAVLLEDLDKKHLLSIEDIFDYEVLEVNSFVANLARNGVVLDERQIKTTEPFYIQYNRDIIAIYEPVGEFQYKPVVICKES